MRRSLLVVSLLAIVGFLAVPSPTTGAEPRPHAEAWVIRIEGPTGPLIEIGRVGVTSGRQADGVALAVAGRPVEPAHADTAEPGPAVSTPFTWSDSTGSITFEGGTAEARVSSTSATARAGLAAANGSGFALASELLTWEQQEQLLGLVATFNETVAPPLQQALDTLGPVPSLLGWEPPRLELIPPTGFIDVGDGRGLAASADVATSPGFASARADTAIGHASLLAGFITFDAVSAEAVSEHGAGGEHRSARAWLAGLRIAGIPVTIDGDGLTAVDGPGPLRSARGEPALRAVLDVLSGAGVELAVDQRDADGELQSVRALELSVPTDAGRVLISLAGASADPPPAPPLPDAVLPPPPPAAAPEAARTAPEVLADSARAPLLTAGGAPASSAGPAAPTGTYRRDTRLPSAVARALRTTFLLLALGGAGSAMLVPALTGVRRRALTSREAP